MAAPARPSGAASAFPNRAESLALRASLLDGRAAVGSWRELHRASGPEEPGIAWISPLLMANLSRVLPDDPWVRNNPHFLTLCRLKGRAMTEIAEARLTHLAKAGIKTVALKGLALGATVYRFPGLRPVSDLDILVPRADVFRAMETLLVQGLKPKGKPPRTMADLRKGHAHTLHPKSDHQPTVDLHWHVLASARGDDDDAFFWSNLREIKVGSTKTSALCVEDQLLHVLVHGVRWTRKPHVRWVADAALLLRSVGAAFDRDRFLFAAKRFDAIAPVQEGLGFVVGLVGEGADLLESARKLKTSRFAAKAFTARATAYEDRSVIERIALRIEDVKWSRRAHRRPKAKAR